MRRRLALSAGSFVLVVGAWAASSCSPADFTSQTVVESVRIFASRVVDKPRPSPGDKVQLELLAYDGRTSPAVPMRLYWLNKACINPANDAYFSCFTQLASGDAGTGGFGDAAAIAALLTPGVDLGGSTFFPEVDKIPRPGASADASSGCTSVTTYGACAPAALPYEVPDGSIIIERTGIEKSYGLVIFFNFACAGKLEVVPIAPNSGNPQPIPFGCFDVSDGGPVGPDGFVFGFTRIFVYYPDPDAGPPAQNPVITAVDTPGQLLTPEGGVTKPFSVSLCDGNCPNHPIGPVIEAGAPAGKQVWAEFYSTAGTFDSEARLLSSPGVTLNIPSGTDNKYTAPSDAGAAAQKNYIWIVVHDDQGGADWVTVPLQLEPPSDGGTEDAARRDGGDAGEHPSVDAGEPPDGGDARERLDAGQGG